MDFLRELVSQKKIRFVDAKYNLDLTYITPRIIAMAYPAEGLESMFRNKISDVSSFLKTRHKENYMIINVSSRKYDFTYFDNRVYSVKWPNHYPCPFSVFCQALTDVCFYMLQNKKNVIAVHCLAGKGRTGSFIDAILFISGIFKTIEEANSFYLVKRAVNVTYASQIRYLQYFSDSYKNGLKSLCFKAKSLKKVIIKTANFSFYLEKQFIVSLYDFQNDEKLLTSFEFLGSECFNYEKEEKYVFAKEIKEWADIESRDILCIIKANNVVRKTKLFRVNFNLFFVNRNITLTVPDLDAVHHSLPKDFSITLKFNETEDEKLKKKWFNLFKSVEDNIDKIKSFLKTRVDKNDFLYSSS